MRVIELTRTYVTVEVDEDDIDAFARRWPCFEGPERAEFTFDRINGDLVAMDPLTFDGAESSALAGDAWLYYKAVVEERGERKESPEEYAQRRANETSRPYFVSPTGNVWADVPENRLTLREDEEGMIRIFTPQHTQG